MTPRKLLALLFALLLVLSLAACGGDDPAPASYSDDPDVNEAINEIIEDELDSFSVEAVEHFLDKRLDMDLESIEPDWEFTVSPKGAYADSPDSGYGHAVIRFIKADGEVSNEEYDAWLQKAFDATAKISQDGHNVRGWEFTGDGETGLDDITLEEAMSGFMTGWAFRHNDRMMVVYVDRNYDNSKESELGNLFYYYAVQIDIGFGLEKSFDEVWEDMEQMLEENEDEIKEALEDFTS